LSDHEDAVRYGRVVSVHGLRSRVYGDDGELYACTVRQLLKSLSTDQRNVVATGDRVAFRPDQSGGGVIDRIEPRYGMLSRTSRGRRHVIATNVDFLLIVTSCGQPGLKPALIDRYLLTAEQYGIRPLICFNKSDLIDIAELQPIAGVYAQLGYLTLFTSVASGQNIDYLRALLVNKQTVLAGQSGVGKSSLLNSVEPKLGLRVGVVSQENEKGKHTTTNATLIPLASGGAVIDTPGIRQFQLWDITAGEVAALMPDLRPYASQCRYPDCLHVHEDDCAIKDAVADGRIDARRYDAYCHLLEEELEI
jgi:ribosome biogenesis GTPase